MRSNILVLLATGPKSEAELAKHFHVGSMPNVKSNIEEMIKWGLVATKIRQVHEGNNVFRWESEFYLQMEAKSGTFGQQLYGTSPSAVEDEKLFTHPH